MRQQSDTYTTLLRVLYANTGRDPGSVRRDMRIQADLGLDSLEAIGILADVCRLLDVVVDEEDLVGVETVGGLTSLLERRAA